MFLQENALSLSSLLHFFPADFLQAINVFLAFRKAKVKLVFKNVVVDFCSDGTLAVVEY